MDVQQVRNEISELKNYWGQRNRKFKEWYEILLLIDQLFTRGMESYVSNEPQTFYNMAHYLLTKGALSHAIPVESESALELDRKAKVNRACQYMWDKIDRDRQRGGNQTYVDELGFYLLVLGWYATLSYFDDQTGLMHAPIWNPFDVYPQYADNKLIACVHSYKISEKEAVIKARTNGWSYEARNVSGDVALDDYWRQEGDMFYEAVLIGGQPVLGWTERPEAQLLVGAIGGFPDKGSLAAGQHDWRQLSGRSIFEQNMHVYESFNKWKSMVTQILKDTAHPITQEFSAVPQATPEQLKQRGAHFHFAPGEGGLHRIPPGVIPIELQGHLIETRREMQKGSFTDAVYGMQEGQTGYSLSLMASSSANQILYPYMDAKHFIISEHDRFWLSHLKTSRRVFEIKGRTVEKLHPTDIPEDVNVVVNSHVATPKDWLEKATIANMLKEHVDHSTIITEILNLPDPQAIKRRQSVDKMLAHPAFQAAEMIAAARSHAKYLAYRGDMEGANTFRKVADGMEAQIGAPEPGQAKTSDMDRVQRERQAGAPEEKATVRPDVMPPEARGFTPQQLRQMIGRGKVAGGKR